MKYMRLFLKGPERVPYLINLSLANRFARMGFKRLVRTEDETHKNYEIVFRITVRFKAEK